MLPKSLAAVLAAAAVLVPAGSAHAVTRLVDDDASPCPSAKYTSIQAAVDAAEHGDVIEVCRGTYDEDVLITALDDAEYPFGDYVVRGRAGQWPVVNGRLEVEGANLRAIRRFVVNGSIGVSGGTVDSIDHNRVHGGGIGSNGGGGSSAGIFDNTITGFTGSGISVSAASNFDAGASAVIRRNRLVGLPGSIGIDVAQGRCDIPATGATADFNTITGTDLGMHAFCADLHAQRNRITGNGAGVLLEDAFADLRRNTVTGNDGFGIAARSTSGTFVRNDARGNGGIDCSDDDAAGNTWIANRGAESDPPGLCR